MAETRVEAIRRLARRGALAPLRRTLEKSRPGAIASAIGHLAPTEQRTVLGSLSDDDDAAEVLARVDAGELQNLVRGLPFDRLVLLLNTMDVDDEADVIEQLPDELRSRVLQSIEQEDKVLVEDILA